MKKVALHNLGCKVNAYETEAMQQMLEENGYEIVSFAEKADIYIINTCSVTNIADRKSRQMLHKAKKQNPAAIVVAMGCYVQTSEEEAMTDAAIDILIGNNKKHDLLEILGQHEKKLEKLNAVEVKENNITTAVIDINDKEQPFEVLHLTKTGEHTRAFIKVQDGCNQFCSYCIIPYARGRVRSQETADVVKEVRALAESGYKEIVLTGIHLSSFGIDKEDNLLHLIKEVHKVEGIQRIRLGSLEPRIITEEFVEELTQLKKVCPHFHLSLQSGCDATLKRMNRRYDTKEYEERCKILRKYFVDPAITTDVIVGFPGETADEFEQTLSYLEMIHFYEMHVFKYSKRKGTKAAVMENQVDEQIKAKRSNLLIKLGEKMSDEYRKKFLEEENQVLLEEKVKINDTDYFVGYTKEYIKIAVKSEKNLENTMIIGKIQKRLTDDVYLMVEFSESLY